MQPFLGLSSVVIKQTYNRALGVNLYDGREFIKNVQQERKFLARPTKQAVCECQLQIVSLDKLEK